MTTDDQLQAALLVLGALSVLLTSRLDAWAKWGWLIALLGQPLWLYATGQAGQWGMFSLSLVWTFACAQGVYRSWRRA